MDAKGWMVFACTAVAVFPAASGSAGAPALTPALTVVGESAGATAPAARDTIPPAAPITFAFTGDIHTLRGVNRGALLPDGTFDYHPIFANVASLLSWFDVASCHMEAPVAPAGLPVFVEPPQLSNDAALVPALADAGYDRCSLASNHMMDRGVDGVKTTLAAFDAAGLGHTGAARSAAEARAVLFEVRGVTFAHLSYTFAAGPRPRNEPWWVNPLNTDAIIADARQARADGAAIVVVSLEWGVDGISAVTPQQRAIARTVTASGQVNLIVGSQAHVVQPIEKVNGVWVVYGMGNFVSDLREFGTWPASVQDAIIATFSFSVGADGAVSVSGPVIYPTWYDRNNHHLIHLTSEADDPTLSAALRAQLRISDARTRSVLGPYVPD